VSINIDDLYYKATVSLAVGAGHNPTNVDSVVVLVESPAIDALKKGLVDLYAACDHVKSKFEV
jgi:hypothetical protein